jgi:hypothetical protein
MAVAVDPKRETLKALVATVVPGNPGDPGGAEADLQEPLISVLDQLQPDASLSAAMYLDEFASDVRGTETEFVCLSPGERDQALARMCAHDDSTTRSLGLFLVAGCLALFYSEIGALKIREKKQAGLLPDTAAGPWEQVGYPGPYARLSESQRSALSHYMR